MPNRPALLALYLLVGVVLFLASGGPARAREAWADEPQRGPQLALLLAVIVSIWPLELWLRWKRGR